jgi:hypothetical protein
VKECSRSADGRHRPVTKEGRILWKMADITVCTNCGDILKVVNKGR